MVLVLFGISSLFVVNESVVLLFTMSIYFMWSTIYTVIVYLTTIWVINANQMWMNRTAESICTETTSTSVSRRVCCHDSGLVIFREMLTQFAWLKSHFVSLQHVATNDNVQEQAERTWLQKLQFV